MTGAPETGVGGRIAEQAVALLEAAVEHVEALVRLALLDAESLGQGLMRRLWVYAAAGLIGLFGLFFLSVALAAWIARLLGSPAGGLAVVGALYVAASAIALIVAGGIGRRGKE